MPESPAAGSWAFLDEVDIRDAFLLGVPMIRSCPHFLRGRLRHAFGTALREKQRAQRSADDIGVARAWKLFALTPLMLMSRAHGVGAVGRETLERRFDEFAQGRWRELLAEARGNARAPCSATLAESNDVMSEM